MLDAYIIDRIRKEREPQKDSRVPLHIHVPTPRPAHPRSNERDRPTDDTSPNTIDYRL